MDAFGRDPREETQFWMEPAREVLETDAVQKAIREHEAKEGHAKRQDKSARDRAEEERHDESP